MDEGVEVKMVAPDPCEHCGKEMVYVGFMVENPPQAVWTCPDEDMHQKDRGILASRRTTEIVSGIVVEETEDPLQEIRHRLEMTKKYPDRHLAIDGAVTWYIRDVEWLIEELEILRREMNCR